MDIYLGSQNHPLSNQDQAKDTLPATSAVKGSFIKNFFKKSRQAIEGGKKRKANERKKIDELNHKNVEIQKLKDKVKILEIELEEHIQENIKANHLIQVKDSEIKVKDKKYKTQDHWFKILWSNLSGEGKTAM